MKSILVTGCNRGLGLGLIKCIVKSQGAPELAIATCRDKSKAKELQDLAEEHQNINILETDITDESSLTQLAKQVEGIVGDDGLNVLFNNAGVSPRSTKINSVSSDQMMDTYKVNVVGPLMLTKALLPLLKRSASKNVEKPISIDRAAIINMSSVLGSVKMNVEGGFYAYRCSKAGLNMATRSLSLDLKEDRILVVCVHPGWVRTAMGGPRAPMTVERSCSSLVQLLQSLREQHHGGFFQWDGKSLPW